MENSTQPRQVWQRVLGQREPDAGALLSLIAGEWSDAATYLYLSRRFSGHNAEVLRQVFQEEQAHAACLKGIYTLITGERPVARAPAPREEQPEITLRRCYGREMQSLAAYEARAGDPEYGPVFTRLADQERRHCHAVLEILGSLQK